jgi:hypothetical protein
MDIISVAFYVTSFLNLDFRVTSMCVYKMKVVN